jgi:nucleoside-diphosphate-sugar epimerase
MTGGKALLQDAPMPATDMRETPREHPKAQQLLGYAPKTSVRDGVARLCEWYRRR